jgi:hypothetical protein
LTTQHAAHSIFFFEEYSGVSRRLELKSKAEEITTIHGFQSDSSADHSFIGTSGSYGLTDAKWYIDGLSGWGSGRGYLIVGAVIRSETLFSFRYYCLPVLFCPDPSNSNALLIVV